MRKARLCAVHAACMQAEQRAHMTGCAHVHTPARTCLGTVVEVAFTTPFPVDVMLAEPSAGTPTTLYTYSAASGRGAGTDGPISH